jgi:uncharacterized membrane protein
MCFGMVVVMTFYNLFINGLIGEIPFKGILYQVILTFIIAFLIEIFIVGPAAQKIAFSLPYDKSKKLYVILSMSFFMVIGMVLFMSLYGMLTGYLSKRLGEGSLLESYYSIVFRNFILAFPLQLFIMGRLVRYLFAKFVKGQTIIEPGSIG